MLGNLQEIANQISLMQTGTQTVWDTDQNPDLVHNILNSSKILREGDSAQFAAGLLYAYLGQVEDDRDEIVACSEQIDRLDTKLVRAFEKYEVDNYSSGNKEIRNTEPYYRSSMANCPDRINDLFEEMADKSHNFFNQEGWRLVVDSNYADQKDLVDQQWEFSK